MTTNLAGASPVDQPVGRPVPKRYEGGRIKGGCSLHDAEKPELCQKHLQRCPEPRTVDCCGVVDEHDSIECSRCGKPTWAGCGQHVEQVMAGIPKDERCSCPRPKSLLGRLLGR